MTKDPRSSSDALAEERSLLALYRTAWKFPGNTFNTVVTSLVAAGLVLYCWLASPETAALVANTRAAALLGLSVATSILGFLIAGFTVFATVTRVDIFVAMATEPYDEQGPSGKTWFQYNLSAFVVVFVHYVAFLFVCVFIVLFGGAQGPIAGVVSALLHGQFVPHQMRAVYDWTVAACYCILMGWTVYIVLLLKSFVFNVYQVLVLVVRWELERPESRCVDHTDKS